MTEVYVIFGATGGVGSTLARQLHQRNAQLILAGRNPDKVKTLAAELPGAETAVVEATDIESVEQCVIDAGETHGQVTGVANCIGTLLLKPAHLTAPDDWLETLHVNLNSAFGAIRGAAKAMRRTGGSVVLVASAAGRIGMANHDAIAAAKGGIIGLTLASAATYANKGIRVNAVAPGLVQTPMTENIVANEASRKASLAIHALDRLGNPEDVAAMMSFLLDPAHNWITGQVIGIDGGLGSLHPRL